MPTDSTPLAPTVPVESAAVLSSGRTPSLSDSPASSHLRGVAPYVTPVEVAPPLVIHESLVRRIVFGLTLLVIVSLYGAALLAHWYPAHPGVDQNGYLVGAKLLARTGSYGFVPANPFSFVGAMWNLGPDGKTYYPKYPLGLPAVYAILIKLFGADRGTVLSHLVSPTATALAVAGTYLMARPYVGGFGAVLAALILGMSPLTFGLATNPNSHAATLACVVWGMLLLLSWWRCGGYWRAGAAGFLLGYALTIRYTEGLLLLPLTIVVLFRLHAAWSQRPSTTPSQEVVPLADSPALQVARMSRPRSPQSGESPALSVPLLPSRLRRLLPTLRESLLLFLAWSLPVAALLAFNFHSFGSPTGYDSTKESTGFRWEYFLANWDLMLREMDDKALALVFPLGLAGLAVMTAPRRGWQLAAVLAAWIFPAMLVYTAYYWAPDGATLGYARFVLTILPGLALAAVWLVVRTGHSLTALSPAGRHWALGPLAVGLVFALGLANMASANADTNIPESRSNAVVDLAATNFKRIVSNDATSAAVIFSEPRTLHHLQFVTDAAVYSPDLFSRATITRLESTAKNDEPHPLQPQRAAALYELLRTKTDVELVGEQNKVMDEALAAGKRIFFIGPLNQVTQHRRRFVPDRKYEGKVLQQWQEQPDLRASRWQRANAQAPLWANRRSLPAITVGVTWAIVEVTARPAPSVSPTPTPTRQTPPGRVNQVAPATRATPPPMTPTAATKPAATAETANANRDRRAALAAQQAERVRRAREAARATTGSSTRPAR